MTKNLKIIGLATAGNILDYYDFMLFAYLGASITRFFIPNLNPTQAHLISLLLFSVPFIIRPLGGYFFGKLSDNQGRGYALGETLKYASFASFGLALLPGYEVGAWISMILFIALRALQGLSLGGEYMTAGTLLMEKYDTHKGLLSGIIGASGTFGSFLAFGFSWFYLNEYFPENAWRFAFGVGAFVTYINYWLRKKLKKEMISAENITIRLYNIPHAKAVSITLWTGFLIGVIFWIPMVYSHFYLTKILDYPDSIGLIATLIALLCSIIVSPIIGYCADRFSRPEKIMTIGAILSVPLSLIGLWLIQQGNLLGQIFLVLSVTIFGSPMHAVLNGLFSIKIRSRYVNTGFMLGTSFGSLVPVVSGYLAEYHQMYQAPMFLLGIFGTITFFVFYDAFYRTNTQLEMVSELS